MSLNEKPVVVTWPPMHFVFVEKIGPFQETAQAAWHELHSHVPELSKSCALKTFMSLYRIEPEMVYRAGVSVQEKPGSLPKGLSYMNFQGGKYSKFTLTGPYDQLPEACGRVFELVEETKLRERDDFYIEHYVNDPAKTPEHQLITEILIPTE